MGSYFSFFIRNLLLPFLGQYKLTIWGFFCLFDEGVQDDDPFIHHRAIKMPGLCLLVPYTSAQTTLYPSPVNGASLSPRRIPALPQPNEGNRHIYRRATPQ